MASSDEEGEIIPDYVTNFHVVNSQNSPIPFSLLPLHWNEAIEAGGVDVAYLVGAADGGLQSVYKEVIGWKLEVCGGVPEFCLLMKGKMWMKLQKPRKSYECVVKSVYVVAWCLHFAKRNVYAGRSEILSHLMRILSSCDLVEPLEKRLLAHLPVVRIAVDRDEDLAKSKYLKAFLMEIENPGRKESLLEENQTTNKTKFIVSDEDSENDDDIDDEAGVFDSVCAFCDNGGDVLPCEGECMRSFHPTIDTGVDTCCESLGFKNAAQYEAVANFFCDNCKHERHQCFVCGKLGSSNKSSPEVFRCVSATCGHFYHPGCVANLLYPSGGTLASQLKSRIAAGKSFTCPIHKCHHCQQGENTDDPELKFAVCRRCPTAYHRKCLPKEIAFEGSDDGTIVQRAWDGLLPEHILMYCMKHVIIPDIWTPKRDHLLFPYIVWKRSQGGSRTKMMSERRSNALGSLRIVDTERMPEVAERRSNTVTYGETALKKAKSSTSERINAFGNSRITDSERMQKVAERRSSMVTYCETALEKGKSSTMHKMTTSYKDNKSVHRNLEQPSKPVKKTEVTMPPKVDNETKTKILELIKNATSSFDIEEYINEKKRRCTNEIYTPQYGLDKTITMGKVEASVKAVKAALKRLEDGGSVEDAKAVCKPNVLNQLISWKKKLGVFLAPFLIGDRYTSFGRHFTKVDKLKEVVNRLHWYVEDGDTMVDFCCGSNDFSWFMKEKLDSTGKKCKFKNYDLITPKNVFNFEKRDWFSVPKEELPDGSGLVIGLNPPFGVHASLANKFIDHALKFKPKLIILIVPEETRRLDCKRYPYDLIWEDHDLLTGKSFYIPGSVDNKDQTLEDWNNRPPPLSLWSRPDWSAKHIKVAEKHGHREQKQTAPHQDDDSVVLNYLMEENHDCFHDFSDIMTNYPDITTMLDDVPEEPGDGLVNMDLSSPSNDSKFETRLNMPCIQPGPHPDFSQAQYAYTHAPGVGFGYAQPGYYSNPGYPNNGSTSSYAQPNYSKPDCEEYVWAPGTTPPRHGYH